MNTKRPWRCLTLTVVALMVALIPVGTVVAQELPPTIEVVEPAKAKQGLELELHIFGENFVEGVTVTLATPEKIEEGIIVEAVEFISETELVAYIVIAPDAGPEWDVTVTNPDEGSYTLSGAFTVSPSASETTPPEPITGLTAIDAHDGKIDLSWIPSDAEDFAYYAIYMSETEITDVTDLIPIGQNDDITVSTARLSDLVDSTEYWVAITAVDLAGNETKVVNSVRVTPTPSVVADTTPPESITGLTATDAHDGKIDLGWSPSTADDFYAYMIFVSESEITSVSGMEPAGKITDTGETSYQVSGLENGVTYYFAVTAIDENGNEDTAVTYVSATSTLSVVPDVTPPPATVVGTLSGGYHLIDANASTVTLNVTWTGDPGETVYVVVNAVDYIMDYSGMGQLWTSAFTYRELNLTSGDTFQYLFRAGGIFAMGGSGQLAATSLWDTIGGFPAAAWNWFLDFGEDVWDTIGYLGVALLGIAAIIAALLGIAVAPWAIIAGALAALAWTFWKGRHRWRVFFKWLWKEGPKSVGNTVEEVLNGVLKTANETGKWVGDKVKEGGKTVEEAGEWVGKKLKEGSEWAVKKLKDGGKWLKALLPFSEG